MTEHDDGMSRRKVLECMTWAGTGVLWTITGGMPASLGMIGEAVAAPAERIHISSDQRQPHGIRQGGQPQCEGDAARKPSRA